jgi:hypothetical protein
MKQVSHWRSIDIRCHHTKFIFHGNIVPWICVPLLNSTLHYLILRCMFILCFMLCNSSSYASNSSLWQSKVPILYPCYGCFPSQYQYVYISYNFKKQQSWTKNVKFTHVIKKCWEWVFKSHTIPTALFVHQLTAVVNVFAGKSVFAMCFLYYIYGRKQETR